MTTTATATSSLVVSEVFGPTVQGEGPHVGQRAAFVRLGGCNLTCTWCDTPYTWDGTRFDLRRELRRLSVGDVAAEVFKMGVGLAVLSGGEPLLQQGSNIRSFNYGLTDLAVTLAASGVRCDVETNGTIKPRRDLARAVDLFVVSPKLAHAGMTTMRTLKPDVLREFAALAEDGRAVFKFVCKTAADVATVARLCDDLGVPRGQVWLMPEGVDAMTVNARSAELVQVTIDNGFNFSTRLHVLLWGSERGR